MAITCETAVVINPVNSKPTTSLSGQIPGRPTLVQSVSPLKDELRKVGSDSCKKGVVTRQTVISAFQCGFA
jgi:hypothetical protein